MNQNEGNLPSSEVISDSENRNFLSIIFAHPKCQHFTEKDKTRIQQALVLALWAHRHQKRKDDKPYIFHIRGSVWDYLYISNSGKLSAEDIIIMILHDVIEDNEKYGSKILDIFGSGTFDEVQLISKMPKSAADNFVHYYGFIFWSVIQHANANGLTKHFQYLVARVSDTNDNIHQLPSHKLLNDHVISLYQRMKEDLRNYLFLCKVISLSEKRFERKCADRVNNLQYLEKVDLDYIEKNLVSTEVFIMKAGALGRQDMVVLLQEGKNALQRQREKLLQEKEQTTNLDL